MRRINAAAAICLACAFPVSVLAQGAPGSLLAPAGVLALNAQASAEVPADVVHITVFHEEESNDPSALTATLSRDTEDALKQTKGQTTVSVSTGAFSVSPSTDRDGRISAWRGRTELLLSSNDIAAASQLAGKLAPGMQVGEVSFSLSPKTQREADARLTREAIDTFRQHAQDAAQAFGYSGYAIREVNINQNGFTPRPMMMLARSAPMAAAAPVPLEAGKTTVTVTVSGTVQMTR
jgi:predicted secreted protein